MSTSASDILKFASALSTMGSETAWRSAGSRAYYAAYHSARLAAQHLPDNAHFDIEGGTHARLIDRYKSYRTFASAEGKKARSIAYVLLDLKQRRESCDYDLDHDVSQDQAEVAVEQAAELEGKLQEFVNDVLNCKAS